MKSPPSADKVSPLLKRRGFLAGLAVVLLLVIVVAMNLPRRQDAPTAFYTVKRGDFTVSVIEGGTLTPVSEVIVRSEVEGTARIISIVPEGTYVQKGDLLIELDSSQAQDQVSQQLINVEKARFAVTNAMAQLEITRSATNSDYLAADNKVRFAEIDRDKYFKGQRQVDLTEASNKIVQAQAQLAVNRQTYTYTWKLYTNKYETGQKLDADGLALTNSQNSLVIATNAIFMLSTFDVPKFEQKYESDVLLAEQELDRVKSQNKRKMDQAYADLTAQLNTLKLSDDKLERDRRNLTNAVIRAPREGLVVYQMSENRFSSESQIEGGAIVRNRQELIKLPDLSRMKVTIKVHESHVNNVRPGQPAFIVLDSMPEQRFAGRVERVAPLPDSQARFGNPNLKVYNTDIYVTDPLPPAVRPGVSAKAEIIVTNINDALSVPIQAVTSQKGRQVVYTPNGEKPIPVPVELGMYNTKYIEVTKGLKEGDRVLLSPPFDTQEKDLGGDVLTDDEKAQVARTNQTAQLPPPTTTTNGATGASPDGRGPGQGQSPRGSGNRRGGQVTPEMLKEFDKDGDGQLSDEERQAMRPRAGGGPGGAPGFDREAMMKQFDKNGDGELDDTERAAMREQFGRNRVNRTNSAPATPPNPPPGE